jgi:hypothetical protein
LRLIIDCDTPFARLALAEVEGGYMASDERVETAKRAEPTKETNERSPAEKNELVREKETDYEKQKA